MTFERALSLAVALAVSISPGNAGIAAAQETSSPPPTAPVSPRVDITTEEGLRQRLDAIESRYEAACVDLAEAEWRRAAPEAGGGHSELAVSRRALAAVLTGDDLSEILAYWAPRRTITRDPTLIRRVRLLNRARITAAVELDPEVTQLADDLAAQIVGLRFSLDGKRVPRAALQRILETEPDGAARRKAWMAGAALPASLQAGMKRLVQMRAAKAGKLDVSYYHHLIQEAQDLRPYWIMSVMEMLMAKKKILIVDDSELVLAMARDAYTRLTADLAKGLRMGRLEPWDLDYAMNKRSIDRGVAKIWQTSFPVEGAVPIASKLLAALGFDPLAVPVKLLPADPLVAGPARVVRIPSDVRLPAPDPAEPRPGIYERILRGHGFALQAAFAKQAAPTIKGCDCLPVMRNGPYAEGMAETMAAFLRDPLFLQKQLGMDSGSIDLFVQDERERELLRFRRLLLDLGMQYTLYVNPDADLGHRYRELYAKALDVTVGADDPVAWEGNIDLVLRPVSSQDRIIGATIAAELHQKFRDQFGDARLGSGKTAAWLIEHCYAEGELWPLEDRMARAFDGGFKFDLYLESRPADAEARGCQAEGRPGQMYQVPCAAASTLPEPSTISPSANAARLPRFTIRPRPITRPARIGSRNWIDSSSVAHHSSGSIPDTTAAPSAVSSREQTAPPCATPRRLSIPGVTCISYSARPASLATHRIPNQRLKGVEDDRDSRGCDTLSSTMKRRS